MTANISFNGNRVAQLISLPYSSRTEYENVELLDLTYSIPLFSRLRGKYSDTLQKNCIRYLAIEYYTKNQCLYEKGESSSKYYILLKGEVSLCETKKTESSDSDSKNDSDDFMDEYMLPQLTRPRSKVIDITPELLYEFSEHFHNDSVKKRQSEVVSQDLIENESKDLIEFIFQTGDFDTLNGQIKIVQPGEDFGQEALCPSKPRRLNAIARTDVQVAYIKKAVLRQIIKDVSHERGLQTFNFLSTVSMFSKWSRFDLTRILSLFKCKVFYKGQYLFKQSESPSHAYIISKGVFAITKKVNPQNNESPLKPVLRNFLSNRKNRPIKIELVLKGEKEFVGTEEIIEDLACRQFSCVCNSAFAEVFEITRNNFLQKVVGPERFEGFSDNLKANLDWLRNRLVKLEDREKFSHSVNISQSFDQGQTKANKNLKVKVNSLGKTSAMQPVRKHSRVKTEGLKAYEKMWKVVQTPKIVWEMCETKNIHLSTLKKNNPRLAPPNFLYKNRKRPDKKSEFKWEEN